MLTFFISDFLYVAVLNQGVFSFDLRTKEEFGLVATHRDHMHGLYVTRL